MRQGWPPPRAPAPSRACRSLLLRLLAIVVRALRLILVALLQALLLEA
jgi:hypothetical protein